ncbi:ArsR/SmtB family transcription factor [uncultured Jatrophihabitans sp.]|uniref:ArsR/SmtB family transcription factor n=1 Tax=uncultured Jatrophihabitans sp. TaxID=1610747 RepID=UPI0035CC8757
MSDEQYEAAGELLKVLSAPIRLAIITTLAAGPATVNALTVAVGHSQPLVSQHLRILRAGRLVHATTEGRERVYELVDEHVARIVADAIRHTAERTAAHPHDRIRDPTTGTNT